MSELITMARPALILNHFIIDDVEVEFYRAMAHDYRLTCSKRPFVKRCELAFMLGSRQFRVSPDDLRRPEKGGGPQRREGDRWRPPPLVETRQKLMAFARIVSEGSDVVNSWKGIGRAFNRHHASVIHAAHKYGGVIAHALG